MAKHNQDHRQDDFVEGEILAELPDETLVSLPPIDQDESQQLRVPQIEGERYDDSRRQLLIRLVVGGAAALALGGSAALLMRGKSEPRVVVLPNGVNVGGASTLDVAKLVQKIDELQSELASVTEERDTLKTQLQAANAELEGIRPRAQAAEALNKLWQSLDEIGLDDALSLALQLSVTAFASVIAVAGALQSGIAQGQAAIDRFVAAVPKPQEGLKWLLAESRTLSGGLSDLATQVEQAVAPVQPYGELISDFVNWVLERLPFGVGAKAKAGLEGMQAVIVELSAFLDGLARDVFDPLTTWFGDDNTTNLVGTLTDPISQAVLTPAQTIQAELNKFQDVFQNKLVTPTQTALDQRSVIRKQIKELQARVGTLA